MRFKASDLNNTLRTAVFDVNVQDVRVTVDDEMYIPPPCTKRKSKREVSICA